VKLIIAGSRDTTDYNIVRKAVIEMVLWKQYGKQIEVVCGMARGVDLEGGKFAKKNGLVIHEFPADWNNKGRGLDIFVIRKWETLQMNFLLYGTGNQEGLNK
jgi:hypothetical protein